jgi:transcriptional regulator with AAA-type ATPase domain
MLEKINKKYNFKLSSLQKEILREYVFTNNIDNLKQMLNEIQINAIQNIDKLKNEFSDNKYLIEKIKKVSSVLDKQNLKEINDKTIIRYFKLIDLNNTVSS